MDATARWRRGWQNLIRAIRGWLMLARGETLEYRGQSRLGLVLSSFLDVCHVLLIAAEMSMQDLDLDVAR